MEKYLKWVDVDKTVTETIPFNGKSIEHNIKREISCTHPLITRVWFHGSFHPTTREHRNYIEIITVDGDRFSKLVTDEQIQLADFPDAEEWLQSLNNTNR